MAYTTSRTLICGLNDEKKTKTWQESWDNFEKKYKKLIFHIGIKNGLNSTEQKELLNDVMLAVYKKSSTFDFAKGKFRTWLSKVIHNKICDIYRVKKRLAIQTSLTDEDDTKPDKAIPVDIISDIIKKEWNNYICAEAMKSLKTKVNPETYRAFEMYVQRLDTEDIAQATGMTEKNVYVCTARCTKKLKGISKELKRNI